jgi:hypothetical protein
MEHKMSAGPLLDSSGNIREPGYSFVLNQTYNRKDIKASKWRIKERDYYYVGDSDYGVAVTIDDNGYMGLGSASVLDFKNAKHYNKANMFWFCFGKVGLPNTSANGNLSLDKKKYKMNFINESGKRHIDVTFDDFDGKKFVLNIDLKLTTPHSMVIATPFKKKKHFYYNQKINLLKVDGYFEFGDLRHEFKEDAYGVLDWGRGVWTYRNTWYWSSLNASQDGHRIGFNLGYGFGDTSASSENMFFYDDEVFKLEDVTFNIPKDEKGHEKYLEPWTFTSKNGDIYMKFIPILDRHDATNALIISQDAHQVFGRFSGYFIVNDRKIEFSNLTGFAEKVSNKW